MIRIKIKAIAIGVNGAEQEIELVVGEVDFNNDEEHFRFIPRPDFAPR